MKLFQLTELGYLFLLSKIRLVSRGSGVLKVWSIKIAFYTVVATVRLWNHKSELHFQILCPKLSQKINTKNHQKNKIKIAPPKMFIKSPINCQINSLINSPKIAPTIATKINRLWCRAQSLVNKNCFLYIYYISLNNVWGHYLN